MKYRRRDQIVEAQQFLGWPGPEGHALRIEPIGVTVYRSSSCAPTSGVLAKTLGGRVVNLRDWIVKLEGHLYVMTPKLFEASYEPFDELAHLVIV